MKLDQMAMPALRFVREALIKAVLAIGTGVSVGDDLTFGRDCAG
jgi:hypothetical protein